MKIIIAGGGKILHFLTKSFLSKGHNVTIIHNDENYCAKLAKMHPAATVVYGNGTRPEVLEDSGAYQANAILAITLSDPENLVICQIAQKLFQIPKTFARVNDPKNVEIFKKLGVTDVISTAQVISSMIEHKVFLEDIINLTPIEEGQVALVELEVHEDYPVVGKTLEEIKISKDAVIGCILRRDEAIIPRGDTVILKDDKLVVLCLSKSQSAVLKALSGRVD